MLFLKDLKNS